MYFSILFASFAYDLLLPHGCYNNLETKRQPFIHYVISFRRQRAHFYIKFVYRATLSTESADFGFIPLLWRSQGPHGCLEKQNCPLSGFLMFFWSFWVLGPILAHQTTKFKLSGWFRFSRHPWDLWGRLNSGVICIWKIFQLFCGCWRHLAKKYGFFKLKPDVLFIILHA